MVPAKQSSSRDVLCQRVADSETAYNTGVTPYDPHSVVIRKA